jgi:transcriptional repressor NrdR
MVRACEKRPVALQEIEKIADDIELELMGKLDHEISTEKIGNLVMDRLKEIDEVAYVRFASVYRQFKDIDTFMAELSKLLSDRNPG